MTSCLLTDFMELVDILMTDIEFDEMVVIMRKLEFRKNAVIFEGSFMHLTVLVTRAIIGLPSCKN